MLVTFDQFRMMIECPRTKSNCKEVGVSNLNRKLINLIRIFINTNCLFKKRTNEIIKKIKEKNLHSKRH